MATPISPSGKKRPKPEVIREKEKEEEMCDCACHDNPNMMHIKACCKRCGEQRIKKPK